MNSPIKRLVPTHAATTMILALLGVAFAACGNNSPQVTEVHAKVSASKPASLLGAGTLQSVNGTYGLGCTARSGAWSILVTSGGIDHPALSVVKNDPSCVLTLTELRSELGVFAAAPSIAMAASWQPAGSAFALPVDSGTPPTAFYANAMITPTNFTSDFVINILYSVDPNPGGDAGVGSNYAVWQGSVSATAVDAPNYTLDASALAVATDAGNIVLTASGTAAIADGSVLGQTYVISMGALTSSPTYAEVDTAFKAATPDAGVSAVASTIVASEFALVGLDLSSPKVRTLIIANTSNGVASYEMFSITFTHP